MIYDQKGTLAKKEETTGRRPRWWGTLSIAVFLVGVISVAFAYASYDTLTNEPEIICFTLGSLLAMLFVAVLFILGHIGVYAYRVRHLLNVGIIPGVLALGFGAASYTNGALDPHPLEEHQVRVVRLQHGYNTKPSYVEDWRDGHEGEELAVRRLPDGVRPGDRVVLVIGPGLIGPWLAGVRLPGDPEHETSGQ